ncbi:GtrA family protein [Sinanaerobacter chloroacetimidivorans]|uniref:GtrA family protein n=1 Tax=Sinanaerobacter chloroacetimidivorans TaxID=2818044 RepID=A0A8J7W3F9_9FIRM|nr:GtrA family protein [Sinanaerobacter chloroacetimidivorans]MBR0598458.1 GtrA family protein [Sinanaerobacter chloroacetimidivorans]
MKILKKIIENQLIRYIFFGVCTTAVNVVLFYLLREVLVLPLFLSNFISISIAILFAFVVNKVMVFESKSKSSKHISKEFFLFLSMRLISMAVEIFGVWFAVEVLLFSDIYGKLMMQVIVIVFNFIFSKYIVFKKGSVSN